MTSAGRDRLTVGFDLRYLQAVCRTFAPDQQELGDGWGSGLATYAGELWRALVRRYPEVEWVALVDRGPLPEPVRRLIEAAPRHTIRPFGLGGSGRLVGRLNRSRYAWLVRALESEFGLGVPGRNAGCDVLHLLSVWPVPPVGGATVTTICDRAYHGAGELIPDSPGQRLQRAYLRRAARAGRLVCISEATRRDLYRYIPGTRGKAEVIYPGVDLQTFTPGPPDPAAIRQRFGLAGPYFLHVGLCRESKNPVGLLQAFREASAALGAGYHLLLAGPYDSYPATRRRIEALATTLGIGERVRILDNVSTGTLALLYRNALALVFPSYLEGFGLPVLEALACGTPCVISSTSALPEAAGGCATLVDPRDPAAIARAMLDLAGDPAPRSRIEGPRWAQRFTWERAAEEHMNVYLSARMRLKAGVPPPDDDLPE